MTSHFVQLSALLLALCLPSALSQPDHIVNAACQVTDAGGTLVGEHACPDRTTGSPGNCGVGPLTVTVGGEQLVLTFCDSVPPVPFVLGACSVESSANPTLDLNISQVCVGDGNGCVNGPLTFEILPSVNADFTFCAEYPAPVTTDPETGADESPESESVESDESEESVESDESEESVESDESEESVESDESEESVESDESVEEDESVDGQGADDTAQTTGAEQPEGGQGLREAAAQAGEQAKERRRDRSRKEERAAARAEARESRKMSRKGRGRGRD